MRVFLAKFFPSRPRQRYVADELTHFVGRKFMELEVREREDRQYALLLDILRGGNLAPYPGAPAGVTASSVSMHDVVCSNEMFEVSSVCFCDIPLTDLGLHMGKYGRFGLSFPRCFLVRRGANPVYYVAMNSFIREVEAEGGVHVETRREYMNRLGALYWPLRAFVHSRGKYPHSEDSDAHQLWSAFEGLPSHRSMEHLFEKLDTLKEFLDLYVFGYVKCFDDALPEENPDNYYLEREWRAAMRIDFAVKDIRYIIVPKRFVNRLRCDVPGLKREQVRSSESCGG